MLLWRIGEKRLLALEEELWWEGEGAGLKAVFKLCMPVTTAVLAALQCSFV